MNNKLLNSLEYINPNQIFGPIFMKELIISSRRRRNYLIRFLYPAVLAFFIGSFFASVPKYGGQYTSVIQASQMARIGISAITSIIWFQFIIVQVLAIAMLSTAISDEIYQRTLGVLMTTPITSLQIVFGKLLSKLFQLLLIVAISFPVLAIIRVFGGVPWNFVFSCICITLTTAVFAGSLSMFFSIYSQQSHLVISKVFGTYFIIYAAPVIANLLLTRFGKTAIVPYISELYFFNPFMLMQALITNMRSAALSNNVNFWVLHCFVILFISLLILLLSSFCVRKVGLRQITGPTGLLLSRQERRVADKKQPSAYYTKKASGKIRDIKWAPVIWREFAYPLIKPNRFMSVFSFLLAICFLAIAYGFCYYYDILDKNETQVAFVLIYFFIGLLRTSTLAAISITTEKEARSWPILLTTPLSPREISHGKIIGSCLRAWGYWLVLGLHLVVFILLGMIKAAILIPMIVLVIGSALLVSSIGVMFSSIFKRSTKSATFNIMAFLTIIIPICCIPYLYFGSPIFAAASIFGVWGGYFEMLDSFHRSPVSPYYIVEILVFSRFSFIIYTAIYLLLAYIASEFSVNHIRWRIL